MTEDAFSLKLGYRFYSLVPTRRVVVTERHIAGVWRMIALQEEIEYLQHESLTNHFFILQNAGFCCLVEQVHVSIGHLC